MKALLKTKLILLVSVAMFWQSCTKEKCEETVTYVAYTPEYMSYDEFRSAVALEEARELENPGKIYFKDDMVYINEYKKGIHIIDNSNPASPKITGFINIPGNVDIAIKGQMLYADSHVDLVTLDISNPNDIKEVNRKQDVFPYDIDHQSSLVDQTKGVIAGWKTEVVTETYDCSRGWRGRPNNMMRNDDVMIAPDNGNGASLEATIGTSRSSEVGKSGSMARFALHGDFLYTISEQNMKIFNLTDMTNPTESNQLDMGWNVIETIFPFNDLLFIGSQTGMLIYDNSTPGFPSYVSEFTHARACDPVVVTGDYAYVTLRANNEGCGGTDNELDVVDISNINNPFLDNTYEMEGPYGLGANSDNTLFVCDGKAGLKVYDISDPDKLVLLNHFTGHDTYDVIPNGNVIMVIGPDGLYQYSYDEAYKLTFLSKLPVAIKQG